MRKSLLLFLVLFITHALFSQQNLSGSRRSSFYTYIYLISAAETIELYKSDMDKAGEKYLHTLVDSFQTDNTAPKYLKDGNYLFVRAENNSLHYELKTIGDLQYKLVNNNRDLVILLHTRLGQLINDADVSINNRKIDFDADTKTYRLSKRKRTGLIKVNYNGVLYLFPLAKNNKHYYGRLNFFAKLAYTFPFKYITRPIKKLFAHRDNYPDYFGRKTEYEQKFSGFMVFSKPKYKPGDTVQLKAWIVNRDKNPVNRNLLLRLTDKRFKTDTILTTLKPYRARGYEYQFVLTDSLDLDLDDEQLITLEELKSKKYDLGEYDGELDDDEYAAKRKVLMRGKFTYEEYELGRIHFNARADKQQHQRGNPVAVYLKATDENDLTVLDGRVQITVTPDPYSSPSFYGAKVFLPDTLWTYTQPLDALGETKIIIPDTIFPASSFAYQIHCDFLNSNNEYQTKSLRVSFENNRHKIYFNAEKDSLQIEQKAGETPQKVKAVLFALDAKDDTLQQQVILLPAIIPINPFVKYYTVKTDSANDDYHLNQSKGMVSAVAARTKDSVTIQAINSFHLPFWYSIFAGNRIVQRGYTSSLAFTDRSRTAKNYFVSLQYIYGNAVYNENYTVPYQDKLLNIQVDQPEFIYPGQHVPVNIAVTNKEGNPVSNADITAYAFTDKFENAGIPYVPYLGKIYPYRKAYRNFFGQKPQDKTGEEKLNWERWSREMGLDSIEYFKFLHPKTEYSNTEPAKDDITQLAPFVVVNGNLQTIHQIYIDEVPYFFSQSQQLQRYSFKVNPGKHALRLRTPNQMIKIDSVWAAKGVKTFISINADTVINKTISTSKMPDSLTNYEKSLWSRYMILVENKYGETPVTIAQSDKLYFLNPPVNQNIFSGGNVLTGPFSDRYASLDVKDKFNQSFETEGNYLFDISKGLIKQKQLPYGKYAFSPFLTGNTAYDFHDFVLTQKGVDSLWQDYLDHRSANEELFRNEMLNKTDNGLLRIEIDKNQYGKPVFVKNILLFRYDDLDFVRVYKGSSLNLGYVEPGRYRLFILLKDDAYFMKDSIDIRKDGINYYQTGIINAIKKDSVSIRIAAIINGREKGWRTTVQDEDLGSIKESFNEKYLNASSFSNFIFGSVRDNNGVAVAGASVLIKGTKHGTTTDAKGNFQLKAPEKGTLTIAYVGYETIEKRITEGASYDVKLRPTTYALNEVVVVGYGVQMKKELTGYVSSVSGGGMLAGMAPGLQIRVRGIGTIADTKPLIIVDGLPYAEGIESLDVSLIASVNVLKSTEAVAIYGSRASNGVIIITTKKAAGNQAVAEDASPLPGNILRRNFRDAAYWQPKLRTDADGKVSFTTVFPDDITKWRTFVIAMGDKKQTGFIEKPIKSFKIISASLSVPEFAVEGDSINIIGKTLNYIMDSIQVKRSFSMNDVLIKENKIGIKNSRIDTFMVSIAKQDSLKLKYTVQKTDGYFDGEERSIPVFRQGVQETKGYFAALDTDTALTLSFDPSMGKIKLHAESSLFPVLLDEIEKIHDYEYLCNEQLASKLKALLLKKRIYAYLKKEFKEEKNINALITKLNQNKMQPGLWGWWNNNSPSMWISLHATEALLLAEKEGFRININKTFVVDYLVYNLEKYEGADKISCLRLLKTLEAKVDFKKYADSLEKKTVFTTLYQKLQFLLLKQQLGMPVVFDTLIKKYRTTMFGNMYWGEDNNHFFDNSVQNTLLMYRLMRGAGTNERQLQKIQNYFLEKRRDGYWRNTYESSVILETILPDLMQLDIESRPSTITINNGGAIKSFPWSAGINDAEKINIKKQGGATVYFTAYQQYWNAAPAKVSGDFTVNSFFEKNDKPIDALKSGEAVTMKVNVHVKADADYVMIEIPIPAGCSYKDKNQQWDNNEVHREYFKNKVSIFCSSLVKGDYTFSVSLLPRYTGSYNLNPAKAEMMYFPVFYGREGMKKMKIE